MSIVLYSCLKLGSIIKDLKVIDNEQSCQVGQSISPEISNLHYESGSVIDNEQS